MSLEATAEDRQRSHHSTLYTLPCILVPHRIGLHFRLPNFPHTLRPTSHLHFRLPNFPHTLRPTSYLHFRLPNFSHTLRPTSHVLHVSSAVCIVVICHSNLPLTNVSLPSVDARFGMEIWDCKSAQHISK